MKCIWKFVSFDKNSLLRGWKLLEFKWGKTVFGEPNNKGQNSSCCVSDPGGRSPLMRPSQLVDKMLYIFLEIVKLTQNVRTKSNIVKTQTTEEHLPLHKIHYLTGQESSQSFLLWTLQVYLSSVNSEEPFEVRHYLSKTLQLFTKSTGSASEWFLSTIYLSLFGLP